MRTILILSFRQTHRQKTSCYFNIIVQIIFTSLIVQLYFLTSLSIPLSLEEYGIPFILIVFIIHSLCNNKIIINNLVNQDSVRFIHKKVYCILGIDKNNKFSIFKTLNSKKLPIFIYILLVKCEKITILISIVISEKKSWIMERKRCSGFRRNFTVDFDG